MNLISILKKMFRRIPKEYTLLDTFGCPECPPQDCHTFLERSVHKKFQNALMSYKIIVVYGESRQGKTWTIERYCPSQLRIGCDASMTLEQIKKEMLHVIGLDIHTVEHSVTEVYSEGCAVSSGVGAEMLMSAGMDVSLSATHSETLKTTYNTVDLTKNVSFLEALRKNSDGRYFVFDNFHYLSPTVQQQFCSLLKEFNYQGIKVIIVGVWKDASRITALAPDLLNRCAHIDIGTWDEKELETVAEKGARALNIEIDPDAKSLFIRCAAHNIGIFKDFVQKYCQEFGIIRTQKIKRPLIGRGSTTKVAEEVISEAYTPLHDRIINLAMPQRERKDSKRMRLKIIIAVLQLIVEDDVAKTQGGIHLTTIKEKLDTLCAYWKEDQIGISNLTQELGLLHLREENRQTGTNFIPLFYFDKANKKMLVLEPTVYVIKEYNESLLNEIADEHEKNINCYLISDITELQDCKGIPLLTNSK